MAQTSTSQDLPAVTSPGEKQGHLGNLEERSDIELRDLLQRQEEIMRHQRHILQRLPDKGAKVQSLIDRLKGILAQREGQVDNTAQLFERMALGAEQSHTDRLAGQRMEVHEDDKECLRNIINVQAGSKVIVDERTQDAGHVTTYDKVTRRANVRDTQEKELGKTTKVGTFVPSKALKHTDLKSIKADTDSSISISSPSYKDIANKNVTNKSRSPGKTLQEQPSSRDTASSKLHYRYDEALESDIHRPSPKHQQTKAIDVDEAIRLQQQQKRAMEELQIQQAAAKLAQRFNVKMTQYHPEGDSSSSYRSYPEVDDDEEHGEDEEEEDMEYPD